jgi:spore maturation protein CgeB
MRGDMKYPGLDLFGDPGWQEHVRGGVRLRPPVDYYTRLPCIYARSRYSLCLTSLQLPQGLNQRHFDVWTAGGFCLSDASPGLGLFPEELTRPMSFRAPSDIGPRVQALENSGARQALAAGWQSCLWAEHRYVHRALAVLDALA